MAEIVRGGFDKKPLRAGINPAQAASVGLSEADMGSKIQQINQQYFDEAKLATQTALYGDRIAKASMDYTTRQQERMGRMVDENGNPTYGSLVDDLGKIGNEVLDETLKTVYDPEVAQKLRQDFGKFISNQQILGLSQARKQHLEYTGLQLSNGIQGLTQQAILDDPANAGDYQAKINTLLDNGLKGGVLDFTSYEKLKKGAFDTIAIEQFRNQISQNPEAALETIDSLALDINQKRQLANEANAAIKDREREAKRIQDARDKELMEMQRLRTSELSLGILDGTVGEMQLEQEKENLSPLQYIQLKKELVRQQGKRDGKSAINSEIDVAIAAGDGLFGFSSSQIDSHYNSSLKRLENPTFAQKSSVVTQYQAPVKAYQKELKYTLINGQPGQAVEALRSYQMVINKNPLALEGLDTQTSAVASYALSLIENTNVPDAEALRIAKEQVLNTSPDVTAERKAQLKNIDTFKELDQVTKVTQKMFGERGFLGLGRTDLAPGVANKFKVLLEQAYLQTGDEDAAIQLVKNQTAGAYGSSELGGNLLMQYPPEKMFPGVPEEELKQDLLDSVSAFTDTPDQIQIRSDSLTRTSPTPSYLLVKKDPVTGAEIPLEDPETGQILRWSPDVQGIQSKIEMKVLSEAQETRAQYIKNFQSATSTGLRSLEAKFSFGGLGLAPPVVNKQKELTMAEDIASIPSIPEIQGKFTKTVDEMFKRGDTKYRTALANSLDTLGQFGINTVGRMKAFLAQIGHESDGLKAREEYISDSKAESQYGPHTRIGRILGNTQEGDGARFKGRGLIQLTGRDNYDRFGKIIGVDLVNNPELAADPQNAVKIAAAFWQAKGLNQLADNGNYKEITRRISGSPNQGYESRVSYLNKLDKFTKGW